jgi:predicted molibdopterin-dependent oxidoreductase YjgC
MTYELLLEHGAIQWPCNERYPRGCTRLYEDLKFPTGIDECESYGADFLTGNKVRRDEYVDPQGKAFLRPVHWRPQPNPPTREFPYVLSTGRVVYHFHTRTKTGRSRALNGHAPHAYVEIHPADAAELNITLGDVVAIDSPRGQWIEPAMVVDSTRRGELFIPFHYGRGPEAANQHTWYARDPVSQQPQFKSAPVRIRRSHFAEPEEWMLARLAELRGDILVPYAARSIGGTVMYAPGSAYQSVGT